jgi:hypothetical protein
MTTLIVPVDAMRRLMAMEQAVADAARRRDESVQLVLATLNAPMNAKINVLPDGTGQIIPGDTP